MDESPSDRRMAENEVIFRQKNEKVQQEFEELGKFAKEDGEDFLVPDDTPLYFYCECSDEKCRERMPIKPSTYRDIHKERDQFVLVNGHENEDIEQVILREKDYCIVKKFIIPPASSDKLNPTDVNNV